MGADYRKFKTPFFRVRISDSKGKKMVNLPKHILGLIEKVEILETFEPPAVSSITLVFTEGSREPASTDAKMGTSGLYKIPNSDGGKVNTDISGSLTNRPGIIADLRFSGNHGITFLTEKERKTGKKDTRLQKNVSGDFVTRKHKVEDLKPELIFQERNQVEVTWGYLEDKSSIRTKRARILAISINYPESGQITTTITCQSSKVLADQISPSKKSITFGKRITSKKNNSLITIEDQNTTDLVKDICNKIGMPCIVSKDLPSSTLDKNKQKVWLVGESFSQFMDRLAKSNNSDWDIITNKDTGEDTLVFIKKTDLEEKLIIKDKSLLSYKTPGSILQSVMISVDFGALMGNTENSITREGKKEGVHTSESVNVRQFGKEVLPAKPIDHGNEVPFIRNLVDTLMEGVYTSTAETTPVEEKKLKEESTDTVADQQSRKIVLEFVTLGYPKLHPGLVYLGNLGVRYSGNYRIITATHTITNSGYTTKCSAVSFALNAGGVPNPEALKVKEEKQEKTNVEQFNDGSVLDSLKKLVGL